MEKQIHTILTILIVISVGIIGTTFYKSNNANWSKPSNNEAINTQLDTNGKQVLEVTAKGGYTPKELNAKANIETILRITTKNTFDCSSALVIPTLKVKKNLPPSGTTDISIPPQKAGTKISVACSMGMYAFEINFN
jgi:plastocyanin domain-containing protein